MGNESIPSRPLLWTGERYLPEIHGSIELEHLHRYLFAKQLALNKRVLDIASGEGYGSALLAQSAATVIGVDIAEDAIAHASTKYRGDNLEYRVGSCSAIPLPDHCVDVVVSFETIEHHTEHDSMMREIKRVLIPGGLLVMSCPDRLEYSDRTEYNNPYHVKELYRDEFSRLLENYFKYQSTSGQRIIYGSAIFSENGHCGLKSYHIDDRTMSAVPGVSRALYLVSIASDAELPEIESGVLEQPVSESNEIRELGLKLINASQSLADRESHISGLVNTLNERESHISGLVNTINQRESQISGLSSVLVEREAEIENLKQAINSFHNSTSWRLTKPLRFVAKFFREK